jgi:dihydrofolate reductase
MAKIKTFTYVSADSYFAGPRGDIDWFKFIAKDDEFTSCNHDWAKSGGGLILGEPTYEMMKGYWSTPEAALADPDMAEAVNNSPKIVFSRTLQAGEETAVWKNVRVFYDIVPHEILRLKTQEPKDLTVLGSGPVVRQLSNLGMIDEYAILVAPVILEEGQLLFEGVGEINLELLEARAFKNGVVLLRYRPKDKAQPGA